MANFRLSGDKAFIGGDLTVGSAAALKNFLVTLSSARRTEIVVDLRGLEMWDSSALQLFLAWMRGNPGMAVTWRNMPPDFAEDLRITGLANLFNGASHGQ